MVKHWYNPKIKMYNINELVDHVKVAANSFEYPLPTQKPVDPGNNQGPPQGGCILERCTRSINCDVIVIL